MPRNARLDMPGLLQHVIVRGIEKRDIFLDDADRAAFVRRFSGLLVDTKTRCYAWALMSNHFHLLLAPARISLGRLMRRLLTGYAVTFNRKHDRAGHLFQNRYKSIVCEEETYLLELIRYIHLNPLRAGLVKSLDDLDKYPWSGHAVLMGRQKMEGQDLAEVLFRFGRNKTAARRKYRDFLAAGVSQGQRSDLTGGGLKRSQGVTSRTDERESFDERILGSGTFVESLLQEDELRYKLTAKKSVTELIEIVGKLLTLTPEEIRRPSKKRQLAEARGVICYFAVRELGYKGFEVGRELSLGAAGVSIAIKRGESFIRNNQAIEQAVLAGIEK